MRHLEQLRQLLVRLENLFAAFSLLTMLVLAVGQIIARNLFHTGLPVADTLTRYMVLYVMFLGALLAVERHRHIKIDVLRSLIPSAWAHHLYRPVAAVAALVCGLFTQAAMRFWWDEWTFAADYERWQVLTGVIIPAGFLLLALHYSLAAVLGENPVYSEKNP